MVHASGTWFNAIEQAFLDNVSKRDNYQGHVMPYSKLKNNQDQQNTAALPLSDFSLLFVSDGWW